MRQFIKLWSRVLWEDFKAWRRGEMRVAPRPQLRGRVYQRKDDPPLGYEAGRLVTEGDVSRIHKSKGDPVLTLKAKVIRKDGTVEYLDLDSQKLTPEQVRQLQELNDNG